MHQDRNSPAATVAVILHEAFASPFQRVFRSQEYVDGAQARLLQLMIGKPFACPFADSTPHADAFFAGADEGTRLFQANSLRRSPPPAQIPLTDLKGHAYISARNLNKPIQRMHASARELQTAVGEVCK